MGGGIAREQAYHLIGPKDLIENRGGIISKVTERRKFRGIAYGGKEGLGENNSRKRSGGMRGGVKRNDQGNPR